MMSGQEDFGPLLEALVTCVGVVDIISLLGFVFNRKNAKASSVDINNNNDVRSSLKVRDKSPISVSTRPVPQLLVDGAVPLKHDDDVIESLVSKVIELEAKVTELEIKSRENSMERFVEIERYRRSRSPSPFPVVTKDDENSSYDDEGNTSSAESRANSVKHTLKPITRDDEFRRTKKRSSQMSHESREDELVEFSKIEQEEMENMTDYVPITYEGQDDGHYRHGISPIQEVPSCPIHGEIERSPEPGMSSVVDKPWGDIKKDVGEIRKQEKRDQMRRSLSIDEQPAAEAKASGETKDTIVEVNDDDIAGCSSNIRASTSSDESKITEPKSQGQHSSTDIKAPPASININEQFIKMEQNALQQQSKLLVKQAHVTSEDQPDETAEHFETIPIPVVEVVSEPKSVKSSLSAVNISAPAGVHEDVPSMKGSTSSLSVSTASATDNVSF